MKRRLLLVLTAALIGVFAGSPGAAPTRADHSDFHMWFAPPTNQSMGSTDPGDGDTSMLTTGWHGGQIEGNYWALDWAPDDGHNYAYTRVWAESNDSQPTVRAYSTPYTGGSWDGCTEVVWVDIYDMADEWKASQGHVHAENATYSYFEVQFATNGTSPQPASWQVAELITGNSSCTWYGIHTHETSVPGYANMGRNTTVYDHSAPSGQYYTNCLDDEPPPYTETSGCPQKRNDDFANWQREFWWNN